MRIPLSSSPVELSRDLKVVIRDYDVDGVERGLVDARVLGMVHLTGADLLLLIAHAASGKTSTASGKATVADHFERTGENMRVHPNTAKLLATRTTAR